MSSMFMNERVEIAGEGDGRGRERGGRAVHGVDEKLVVLHRTLKRIAKARAHLDLQEAEALRDAQQLQLWRQFGHASLADYMVQELGYSSHRVAEDRLRLANALPQLPMLSQALQNGDLNFSHARELARVATPQTEAAWIEKTQKMNVREVEQTVAGHHKGDLPEDPVDPRLVRKTLWISVRPETLVLFREAKQKLERDRGERLDEDALLEAMCRVFLAERTTQLAAMPSEGSSVPRGSEAPSRPRGRESSSGDYAAPETSDGAASDGAASGGAASGGAASGGAACGGAASGGAASGGAASGGAASGDAASGGAPYRIAVTVCTECKRGWQHGGGAVEQMTPAAVETARCDAQWIGDLDSNDVERAHQEISPATRRKVLHRDQQRCQVPGCSCHSNLDIHHIVHREHGGTNDLSNLTSLCEAHHLAHHAGTLTIERVDGELRFRREGRNNFTRATREVATRQALRERGLERELIAQIMARTIAYVGGNDCSAEQWLTIALRYVKELSM
jgi:hypothetical protein